MLCINTSIIIALTHINFFMKSSLKSIYVHLVTITTESERVQEASEHTVICSCAYIIYDLLHMSA